MSRSVNKILLLGNVGNDPDVRTTTTGQKVAAFSLATGREWTDATGAKQSVTHWHRCVAWDQGKYKLADIVAQFVQKGAKLFVEGEMEYRSYADKEGVQRTVAEVRVRELTLLGDRGDRQAAAPAAPKPARAAAGRPVEDFPDEGAFDDDDDLPF